MSRATFPQAFQQQYAANWVNAALLVFLKTPGMFGAVDFENEDFSVNMTLSFKRGLLLNIPMMGSQWHASYYMTMNKHE